LASTSHAFEHLVNINDLMNVVSRNLVNVTGYVTLAVTLRDVTGYVTWRYRLRCMMLPVMSRN